MYKKLGILFIILSFIQSAIIAQPNSDTLHVSLKDAEKNFLR